MHRLLLLNWFLELFELIFFPSAAYGKRCAFSYLLVSRISLASCRAVCFPALVEILVEVILDGTDSGSD